jgi:hypothetical protein
VTAPDDARIHVDAHPATRTVRMTIIAAPARPDVKVDLDVDAVRELAAALLDSLTALAAPDAD